MYGRFFGFLLLFLANHLYKKRTDQTNRGKPPKKKKEMREQKKVSTSFVSSDGVFSDGLRTPYVRPYGVGLIDSGAELAEAIRIV